MPDFDNQAVLEADNLITILGGGNSRRQSVTAVAGVNLTVRRQDVIGIVGESGSGKSTLARTLLGIQTETSGDVRLHGEVVSGLPPREARRRRSAIQYVHQDAAAALDPWWSIGHTLAEGLKTNGTKPKPERTRIAQESLHAVGLSSDVALRFPHELSGGQLRRVGIARILALRPQIVILDEPTAGLDTSVQAGVLRLLIDLHREFGLTYLLISHDLSVVKRVCNKVAIMYLGRIVEFAEVAELFSNPLHPYSRALLGAAPTLSPDQVFDERMILGEPPSSKSRPAGCSFHPRCPFAISRCKTEDPLTEKVSDDREVACWRWREIN
jgi:oligopeptide/dipeptide ABC transporter ATP-binding protein